MCRWPKTLHTRTGLNQPFAMNRKQHRFFCENTQTNTSDKNHPTPPIHLHLCLNQQILEWVIHKLPNDPQNTPSPSIDKAYQASTEKFCYCDSHIPNQKARVERQGAFQIQSMFFSANNDAKPHLALLLLWCWFVVLVFRNFQGCIVWPILGWLWPLCALVVRWCVGIGCLCVVVWWLVFWFGFCCGGLWVRIVCHILYIYSAVHL